MTRTITILSDCNARSVSWKPEMKPIAESRRAIIRPRETALVSQRPPAGSAGLTDVERLKADCVVPILLRNPPPSPIRSEWQPFLPFRALLRRLVDDRPKLPQLANGIGELLR